MSSKKRICPRCGSQFTCGVAAGEEACWCFELPPVVPIDQIGDGAACLCPGCLRRLVARQHPADEDFTKHADHSDEDTS